jgi:hypothetical protein
MVKTEPVLKETTGARPTQAPFRFSTSFLIFLPPARFSLFVLLPQVLRHFTILLTTRDFHVPGEVRRDDIDGLREGKQASD